MKDTHKTTIQPIDNKLLQQVNSVVNSVANIVIYRWLVIKDLPHTASSLRELSLTICNLINEKKVDLDEFLTTFRNVEECSGKVTYLRKIPDLKLLQNDNEIREHLTSRLPTQRSKKFETIKEPDEPTFNYLLITKDEVRMKFSETHFNFVEDVENEVLVRKPFTVLVVISIDRATGFTCMFLDSPGKKHPYPTESGKFTEKGFFDHYLEKLRIMFPKIQVADFGEIYNNLLKELDPKKRCLKATTNSDTTNDNLKRVLHGTDLMTAPTFSELILKGKYGILHDYATVKFLRDTSNKALLDDVFVRIYPGEGKISIPSIRLPQEVDYVISKIRSV